VVLNLIKMKKIIFLLILQLNFSAAYSANELIFFLEAAYKNNPRLNAERENLKAIKQNINISRSEFLPSVSVSGSVDSKQNENRTNQSGVALSDTQRQTETKSIEVDQKIFHGFQGLNSLKKSQLEVKRANFELLNVEQETILKAASAYFDLIYKTKNKNFNIENMDLFERQVESDSSRLQKGEITFTDLAQSESSLAGAKAKLINAETELLTSEIEFERIIGENAPKKMQSIYNIEINLPESLNDAFKLSNKNNPKLMIAKLDHEISKKDLSIEKSKLSPSASINYSKSEQKDFSSTVDKSDDESLKATVTWPILSGGKNFSSVKKSQFKLKQSNLNLNDILNSVRTTTSNSWSVYKSSGSVLKATKSQVKAAEIANEGITLEYDSGNKRTTLEMIQSRSLLLDARIANAKAERDFIVSKLKLLSAIGNLNLNSIKKP